MALIDLSRIIEAGMTTDKGLPAPLIRAHFRGRERLFEAGFPCTAVPLKVRTSVTEAGVNLRENRLKFCEQPMVIY